MADRAVPEELLAATDESGEPNSTHRAKGAELALKYNDVLDGALPDEEEFLPEGVILLYPIPPDARPRDAALAPEG